MLNVPLSALNRTYGDDKHRLDDTSTYSILNVITVDSSAFEFGILEDF